MFIEVHNERQYFWNETFRYLVMKKKNYFVDSLQGLCCYFLFGLVLLFPIKMLKLSDHLELLYSNSQLMNSKSRIVFLNHYAALETSFFALVSEINRLHVLRNRKKTMRG